MLVCNEVLELLHALKDKSRGLRFNNRGVL